MITWKIKLVNKNGVYMGKTLLNIRKEQMKVINQKITKRI